MAIDVHAHVVPATWLESAGDAPIAARRDGGAWSVALPHGQMEVPTGLTDVDARLAAMDAAGVAVQVLSAWIELGGDGLDPAAAAEHAEAFNTHLAQLVAAHPARFDGLGIVPAADPVRAAATLGHAVDDLGLAGIELLTTAGGHELDDPALEPLWAAAAERRALVLLHPHRPRGRERMARHRLGDVVANPTETSAAVGHLIGGEVLARHPDLRLCCVHGGGTLVALAGRFDAILGAVGGRRPSEWLRELHVDSLTHSPRMLRAVVETFGDDRVVLGSDHPFEVGDPDPLGSLDRIEGLAPAQRDAIAEANLRRLLDDVRRG